LAVLIFAVVSAQEPKTDSPRLPPPPVKEEKQTTIRVDVKLVNVFVTVTDEKGTPVADLTQRDFQILEDDQPQSISVFDRESELPLSIVLAIDTSLSTRKDLKVELESARRFVRSIVRPVDALSVYQFSEVVDELVPFTSNLARIDAAIQRARVGAATALFDAVYLAGHALENRTGRKVIVVITDGGDTISSIRYAEAVRSAVQSEAIVYSIIVVPIAASAGRNIGGENALIQISKDTGGKHYYAQSDQLDAAFEQISRDLRTQYLLAYYPRQRLSGSEFRRIRVLVRGAAPEDEGGQPAAGFQVRHRSGYFTSKAR
jgi:Ca-activated chloride channel family protein